jgi:hypothetical protein
MRAVENMVSVEGLLWRIWVKGYDLKECKMARDIKPLTITSLWDEHRNFFLKVLGPDHTR